MHQIKEETNAMNIENLTLDDYDEFSLILYDGGDGGDGDGAETDEEGNPVGGGGSTSSGGSSVDASTAAANIAGVEAGAGGSLAESLSGIANAAGFFGGQAEGFANIAGKANTVAEQQMDKGNLAVAEQATEIAENALGIAGMHSSAAAAATEGLGASISQNPEMADVSVGGQPAGPSGPGGGAPGGPGGSGHGDGGSPGGTGGEGGDDDLEQALLTIAAEPTRDPIGRSRRTTRDTGAVGLTDEGQLTSTPERDARLVQRDPRPQTRSGNQVSTNELTRSPRSTFKGFEDFVSGTGAVGDTGALFRQIEDTSTLSHGQWNFLGFNPYLDDDRIETKERRPYLGVS